MSYAWDIVWVIFHLSPCMVALFLYVLYLAVGRNPRNPGWAILCLVSVIYFLADALYVTPGVDIHLLPYADLAGQFLLFCLLPAVTVFLYHERFGRFPKPVWFLMFLPALLVGLNSVKLAVILGSDTLTEYLETIDGEGGFLPKDGDVDKMLSQFYLSEILVNRILALVELLGAAVILAFLLRRSSGRFKHLCAALALMFGIGAVRATLGRHILINHIGASAILSACIGMAGVALGYFFFFNKEDEVEESYTLLRHRFKSCVELQKLYLRPNVRIDEVAAMLGTNRVILSAMINSEFGMTFKAYLRVQRDASLSASQKEHQP